MSGKAAAGDVGRGGDQSGLRVVIAALAVNIAIAVFKFIAAGLTRSSAMLAEACHSTGRHRQSDLPAHRHAPERAPARRNHPFGYGPETYFWAFMVALCIFSVGGGFSVHEGVEQDPASSRSGAAARPIRAGPTSCSAFRSCSRATRSAVAMREFRHIRAGRGVRRTLRETRDPTVLTVLFEDLAALFGLVVAFGGIVLARVTGNVAWDGAASIVVGLALGAVAFVLARDTKSLLIGQSVNEADEARIRAIVSAPPRRRRAGAPAHHAPGARGGHRRHQGALPRQPRHAHARAAHQRDRGATCAQELPQPAPHLHRARLRREPARQALQPLAPKGAD